MSEIEGLGLWPNVETSKRGLVSWLLGWVPTLKGCTMLKSIIIVCVKIKYIYLTPLFPPRADSDFLNKFSTTNLYSC